MAAAEPAVMAVFLAAHRSGCNDHGTFVSFKTFTDNAGAV
jgi:hypothetical protein